MCYVVELKNGQKIEIPEEMIEEWKQYDVSCRLCVCGYCVLLMYDRLYVGSEESFLISSLFGVFSSDIQLERGKRPFRTPLAEQGAPVSALESLL